MTARDDILAAVRAALRDAPTPEPPSRAYRDRRPADDLAALFHERVADYRAQVVRCRPGEIPDRIAEALAGARTVVPGGFPWPVPNAVRDTGLTPRGLDALDAVVTTAALGIAETGTVVLDHGPGQGRRALTLVPDLHVCVIGAAQIVPTVPTAFAQLDPARPLTWISGPSATSDIELSRVEGVHGPRVLKVLLVH